MRFGLFAPLAIAAIASLWVASAYLYTTSLSDELKAFVYNTVANLTNYAPDVNARLCIKSMPILRFMPDNPDGSILDDHGYIMNFTTVSCDIRKTLEKQSNGATPSDATVATYLGQCTPDFGLYCVEAESNITIHQFFDKSGIVLQITEKLVSTPPPPPVPTKGPITGAYSPIPLTSELSTLLYSSLASQTLYSSSVSARVCIKSISLVESQVVAGTNFRFTTTACDVRASLQQQQQSNQQQHAPYGKYLGQCQATFATKCVEVNAVVVIYRRLDSTLQVSTIDTTPKGATPATAHAM